MKVFMVENSASLRERLGRVISGLPGALVVGHAANAADAIDGILQTKPDVVTLDILLDQGSGYQVLEKVKTLPQPPTVIVLTNYPYPQYRAKYLAGGADYFFDKSVELVSVVRVLKRLGKENYPDGTADSGEPAAL
jgi:DNA-binding NarL/FixJ family response regulator